MTTTSQRVEDLTGKTALITGGSAGIGRASAILLARHGAQVAITGRNEERGRKVAREIEEAGGEAHFMVSDVRFADQCQRAVGETLERYGRIDILFNNAGVYYPNTVPDCSESEWDLTIDTSLKGAFLMSKYSLPSMIERGSGVIIHCSSGWGIQGGERAAAYCAAKGGLVVMTKAMAIDHGPRGIRVNCICPGDTDTPMLPDDAKQRGLSWESYLEGASDRPMGRIGSAEEIARAVLFLSTDASSFVTGTALVVDGGGIAG
ncbi:MAG TPA: SDR family NAD(P)-dependent oxidoreductase [Vicinamibacterales bacterium]|jgi:NAD(P)-dependent dehydrogenase (short-subunit alcohol dehydrogenase family)|nr:short-chain dehydrogenase [Acidobacteriota bacterium]HJO37734.1 SDR family NAD(P)-dependent oxidoreductase [Vicinamibacterales bacterium]|tara:strand:- start:1742 stop:2527 length:786 start_codon:yes stop_codon:yes gene_type:complete